MKKKKIYTSCRRELHIPVMFLKLSVVLFFAAIINASSGLGQL